MSGTLIALVILAIFTLVMIVAFLVWIAIKADRIHKRFARKLDDIR